MAHTVIAAGVGVAGTLLVADGAGDLLARHGLLSVAAFLAPEVGRLVRAVGAKENRVVEVEGRRFHLKRFSRRGPENGVLEYVAATRALRAGVPVAPPLAAGRAPGGASFILFEEVADAEPLFSAWRALAPEDRSAAADRLAKIARRLHDAGIFHSDLNLWHVLRRGRDGSLVLIDLGRARLSPWFPSRWRVKDLASLAYSAAEAGVPQRLRMRFLARYARDASHRHRRRLAARAIRKAARIARHERKKAAPRR